VPRDSDILLKGKKESQSGPCSPIQPKRYDITKETFIQQPRVAVIPARRAVAPLPVRVAAVPAPQVP
jgi:hypothetical protein